SSVRAALGAHAEDATVAVGAPSEAGTVVRMHARDARSADRDLRAALGLRIEALGGATPAGAPLFLCNERGRAARRRARLDLQRAGPRHVRRARPRRAHPRRGTGRRPGRRLLRRGRDRAGRRRSLPAWVHRHRGSISPAKLTGRTVLLTGATGGLGHAIARRLHAEGAHLVLTGRRTEILEPLAAETREHAVAAHRA